MTMNQTQSQPTDREIRNAIDNNAAELAEAEENGIPGTTRISLHVERQSDGEVVGTVKTHNSNATPLPGLNANEVYLFRIADALDWNEEEHREWWLSGEGVKEDGLDFFQHRLEGPSEPRYG
jgi:hypothetical protein